MYALYTVDISDRFYLFSRLSKVDWFYTCSICGSFGNTSAVPKTLSLLHSKLQKNSNSTSSSKDNKNLFLIALMLCNNCLGFLTWLCYWLIKGAICRRFSSKSRFQNIYLPRKHLSKCFPKTAGIVGLTINDLDRTENLAIRG